MDNPKLIKEIGGQYNINIVELNNIIYELWPSYILKEPAPDGICHTMPARAHIVGFSSDVEKIKIPNGINYNCIYNIEYHEVTNINTNQFYNYVIPKKLKYIEVEKNNNYYKVIDNIVYSKSNNDIILVPYGRTYEELYIESIYKFNFDNLKYTNNIKKLIIK